MLEIEGGHLLQKVVSAYMKAVGRPAYFRLKLAAESKTAQSALAILTLADRLHISVDELIRQSVKLYDAAWCEQTFGKDHPPFAVVVSDKARARLVKKYSDLESRTLKDITDQAVSIARNLLSTLGRKKAIAIVAGGWPEDKKLRDAVKKQLEVAGG